MSDPAGGVNHVWIGLGGGPPKLCVGGADAASFKANLAELFGSDMLDTLIAFFDGEAQQAVMRAANQAVTDAGIASALPTAAAGAAATTPQPPAGTDAPTGTSAGQTATSAPTEETDKWGNAWAYSVPGAPVCPHGPRVRKAGKSRAGKDYVGWACVTHSPYAYRSNIPKDNGCAMEFS